jgi:hypothetical protein
MFRHRKPRIVAVVATSLALSIATVAPTSAQEPAAGVGSSSGAASLLKLALGSDALVLQLLGEATQTSNDPGAGGPAALERISPLLVTSSLLPALGGVSQPTIETSSTNGEDARATQGVDLGALLAATPVAGLLDGSIDPVALRSVVDPNGALSAATAAVRDISLLGGLLSTGTATADLASQALVTDAGALRGLSLDSLEVLDLTALLDALGISLADLPIDAAVGLLDGLGLPLPGGLSAAALLDTIDGLLDSTTAVRAQVATLQGQIDGLQAQLAPLTSQLSAATALVTSLTSQLSAQQALLAGCGGLPLVCDPIQALITSLTTQLATATASANSIDAAIDAVQAQIDSRLAQIDGLLDPIQTLLDQLLGLVDGILSGLDGAPLVTVRDLVVGVAARADDTVAESDAQVLGSVGDVQVGGLSLGGLDPAALLAQVTALADQVTGTLGGILSTVDPSLSGLVDIDLLEQATSVTEADGVTEAFASITGLRATITPPDICGLLARLGAQDTIGSVLGGLGEALPSLPGPVGDVLGDLGSTVTCNAAAAAGGVTASALVGGVASALTQPLTIEALSLAGAGSFSVAGATSGAPGQPTPGSLPNTGGEAQLALLALGVGALGLLTRRLLVRAA